MKGSCFGRNGYRFFVSVVMLAAMTTCAFAQDWINFKGDASRTGKSTAYTGSGPGTGVLTWFRPNFTDGIGIIQTIDNLSMMNPPADPPYVIGTGVWSAPDPAAAASSPFVPTDLFNPPAGVSYTVSTTVGTPAISAIQNLASTSGILAGDVLHFATANVDATVQSVTDANNVVLSATVSSTALEVVTDTSTRTDYAYSQCIASSLTDNAAPLNPTDTLSVWTWTMRNPTTPFYESHNYAIYAYIPVGPTTITGVQVFPQRYYVYQVISASGTFTDVVDTDVSGGGLVRLGGGGHPTDMLFPSDGINPIQVKLFNTVPRDAAGVLTTNPSPSGPDLNPALPRPLVYADMVKAIPIVGTYAATPIVSQINGGPVRTVAALNTASISNPGGVTKTTYLAVVSSYDFNTGLRQWSFSPILEDSGVVTVDDTSAIASGFTTNTVAANYYGTDYLDAPITGAAISATALYKPTLKDASYDIYVWIPGDSNGQAFGHATQYIVHEGSGPTDVATTVPLDQSGTLTGSKTGWVRLGTRSFADNTATGKDLTVEITNASADPSDIGRVAYADAIKFVGPADLKVNSTPIQTTTMIRDSGGALTPHSVVIVAAENGVIYCLDATGRGDGSTDVLWTYPSTPDASNPTWKDPNLIPTSPTNPDGGIDGTNNSRIAEMPTGFGLSSPLIANVGGNDYLYIGSTNGRVYCIDMAGRGDRDTVNRKPGTTHRIWTYPDDYPATKQTKALGEFIGSVAFGTNTAGPTIFVPAREGRVYALAADGNATTHVTTTRWTYPALSSPQLGEITSTPAIDFNQVFIGTHRKNDASPGQFYALNWDTGVPNWTMSGNTEPLSDFDGGPATVPAADSGGLNDTVFVSNGNRGVYALDAATGVVEWETYELSAAVKAPVTFTNMNVFDTLGAQTNRQVLICPQSDGRVSVLNAGSGDITNTGGRFAQGYDTQAKSLTSSVAVGWNFMYFGDNAGYLYAFSNTAGIFPPGEPLPVTPVAGGNDPGISNFKDASVRLIKKSAYLYLRDGSLYYADAVDPVNQLVRSPMAFEWGETMYLLISNFKYQATGTPQPPVINVNFSMNGQTLRNVFTEARFFPDNSDPATWNNSNSGYGVLMFTIQPAGANALPPGPGQISIGFNTVDGSGSSINYPATQTQTVYVANPLALNIPGWNGPAQMIGNTNNTSDADNLLNGDPANKAAILGTVGTVSHGESGDIQIGVIDRSLVELIRGPGRGLTGVRVDRGNLLWQTDPTAGYGAPLKPLDPVLFPGFEDLPSQYPNISLDYPDILRQQVSVTSGSTSNAQNPVNYSVELVGPTASDGSLMTEDNANARALLPTPWDVVVAVPRFQPTNQKPGFDLNNPSSGAAVVPAGYTGTYYVYVDTSGNGLLDRPNSFIQTDPEGSSADREAYRSFTLATSVSPDVRFAVTTPSVDLGSLAEGAGYTPDAPGPANVAFDPWGATYTSMFKPFDIVNLGNVNLRDLRLMKSTTTATVSGPVIDDWQLLAPANEEFAYLDGTYDLWSDMDPAYAPMHILSPDAPVIGQKSRVGDRFPRKVTSNPFPRINNALGVTVEVGLVPNYPIQSPRVAVTIPFGFPVGTYIGYLKIVEKDPVPGTSPDSMTQDFDVNENETEPFSDPGLKVIFKPTETRLTNTFSRLDAPSIDNLIGGTESFRFSNMQPTGLRHPANGSLVVAFSSNRKPGWSPPTPTATVVNPEWRIRVASVQGIDPKDAPGTSPLRDLNAFVPDNLNGRWFLQSTQTANGFPDPSIDSNIWGTGLVGGTAKYGSPVFPENGFVDPFRDMSTDLITPFPNALMAFVGEARVNGSTKSEIFVAPVTVDNGGATGIGDITAMTNDADATKGRPSIVQTDNGFILFYAATVGGRSNIYFVLPSGTPGASRYDGSYFTDSTALDLGEGFEAVSAPNAIGRTYRGAGTSPTAGDKMIDLTFTGKLRGRPVSEVFYGRLSLDVNKQPSGFLSLPVRTRETIFTGAEAGTFLANGVRWITSTPITLEILRSGTYTDIEKAGTRQTERGTGIITFDTLLGGKAYLDPTMGTVRLSGSMPPHDASLVLTYQPRFLRVSEGTSAGYASPNLAVDERYIPDISYWRRAGDGSDADANDPIRMGRYLFTYARAAAGSGQAARPMLKSMRFGVDLPLPVFTNPDGTTGPVSVAKADPLDTGTLQYYQIDPAKKKIYFTPDDENRLVTITFEAADEGTGADLGPRIITARVEMITERSEELIPMDEATNETNLAMFLDPFDHADLRRPGLVWLLWSSTRTGAPDIYMQTIAPRFTPLIAGK